MATTIVGQHEYRLSEEDRRSILEQTPAGLRTLQIERQRAAFRALNGSDFGDLSMVASDASMARNATCIA